MAWVNDGSRSFGLAWPGQARPLVWSSPSLVFLVFLVVPRSKRNGRLGVFTAAYPV